MPTLKTIHYRGGIVSFEIPEHWREEYEPAGGGTFYEDRPDSGTLRLSVLGFTSKEGTDVKSNPMTFGTDPHEVLPNGLALRHITKETEEEGETLKLYTWQILVPVPPRNFRMACFTHTILATQENDPAIKAEITLIEKSIRTARYSAQADGPSGDYRQGI